MSVQMYELRDIQPIWHGWDTKTNLPFKRFLFGSLNGFQYAIFEFNSPRFLYKAFYLFSNYHAVGLLYGILDKAVHCAAFGCCTVNWQVTAVSCVHNYTSLLSPFHAARSVHGCHKSCVQLQTHDWGKSGLQLGGTVAHIIGWGRGGVQDWSNDDWHTRRTIGLS
jgi:hypothetical protein